MNGNQGSDLVLNTNVLYYGKFAFEYLSSFPETRVCIHTHTHTHTHRPSFEVSTQIIILTDNLEGIKSIWFSSLLSQFSSLHRTAKSRISKACPKVAG
jgi:hypothetical protein